MPVTGSRPITSTRSAAPSKLVFDEPQRVAQWAAQRLPDFIGWEGWYAAIGRERPWGLDGAVVFSNYTGTNLVASVALDRPFTRRFLYAIFHYPFVQLRVPRLTIFVDEANTRSHCLCKHLGFRVEGRLRQGAAHGRDVIVMGMLRSECRFLKAPP